MYKTAALTFVLLVACQASFLSFDFKPSTPQSIPNPLGSSITLKCTITSTDASDVMIGKMISGTGSVNGQTVPAQGISFTVSNSQVVTIAGSSGSEVQITNQGSNNVHADCDLAAHLATPAPTTNSFLSLDFPPNSPKSIPNPVGVDLALKCRISTRDRSDSLFGKMVSGVGSVNGQEISTSGLSFEVKNGDVVFIKSSVGSEVSILNTGSSNVHANCDLANSLESHLEILKSLKSHLLGDYGTYDFEPKVSQTITNPLFWSISASCALTTSDPAGKLHGVMTAGTGTLNGQAVPASGLDISVKNGDNLAITASAEAGVTITNTGTQNIHAQCGLTTKLSDEHLVSMVSHVLKNMNSLGHYDFEPNVALSISNPLFWQVSATCKLTATDASDVLSGKMLAGTGSLNGQTVPDSGIQMTIKNGDNLAITASAEAEVSIVNLGKSNVHADCSLAALEEIENLLHKFNSKRNQHHKKHRKHHKRGGRKFFVEVIVGERDN